MLVRVYFQRRNHIHLNVWTEIGVLVTINKSMQKRSKTSADFLPLRLLTMISLNGRDRLIEIT